MASLVRPREVARSVAPIELFFDLVYVFTVSQLSSNLIHDVSLQGIVETLVLALAVMYAWFMTVWTSNWLDVERRPVQLMLLGLMFATLLMATSVAAAFGPTFETLGDDRAGLFVIGYLAIQVGRTLFAVSAFRGHRLHRHFVNALVWEIGTGLIWIAGVFADGDTRLAIWSVAVLVTYGGVIAGHPLPGHRSPFSSDSQIYAEHLLERFRLFFLIALGETVLTIGKAFVEVPVDAGRLVALAASFLGTISLWWCYFHRSERVGIDAVRSSGDGSRLVAVGNYTLIAMVVGIIGIAVGDELAIAEPSYDLITTAMAALIFGGPAVFLLAQLAFFHQATGEISQSRIVACIALALLALVTASFTLLFAVIAASLVLLGVAIADTQAG
ncbi:MAG TPA: low temperature requirement protein A [Solirubrobacterales bacterium]|nr:low temperature requirement protein A [Solirubrobacterales bacterium]